MVVLETLWSNDVISLLLMIVVSIKFFIGLDDVVACYTQSLVVLELMAVRVVLDSKRVHSHVTASLRARPVLAFQGSQKLCFLFRGDDCLLRVRQNEARAASFLDKRAQLPDIHSMTDDEVADLLAIIELILSPVLLELVVEVPFD